MTTPTRLTNPELVTAGWIGTLSGFSSSMVATTLPTDTSTWAASGFVTVGPVLADRVLGDQYGPRVSRLQVSCWAVPVSASSTNTSNQPPWGRAADLAERIYRGCHDEGTNRRELDFGPQWPHAFVSEIVPSMLRRINGEPKPTARYDLELSLLWAELPV